MTLLGVLLMHAGHELRSSMEYVIPQGRVFGTPHVYVDCITCHFRVWDEALGEDEKPLYYN